MTTTISVFSRVGCHCLDVGFFHCSVEDVVDVGVVVVVVVHRSKCLVLRRRRLRVNSFELDFSLTQMNFAPSIVIPAP